MIRYGTEHPPRGTSRVDGIVMIIGLFVTTTVYFDRLEYTAEMEASDFIMSNV